MEQVVELEKKLTANQLYKIYKDEGGTLTFSDWLTREKTKGVFPLNGNLNDDIQTTLKKVKKEDMDKTILGFPVKTLVITGAIIIAAVVIARVIRNKKA